MLVSWSVLTADTRWGTLAEWCTVSGDGDCPVPWRTRRYVIIIFKLLYLYFVIVYYNLYIMIYCIHSHSYSIS